MSLFCVWICEFGFRCLRAFGLWMSGSWVEWVELRDTLKIGKRVPKSATMAQWQADGMWQHGRRNTTPPSGKALWQALRWCQSRHPPEAIQRSVTLAQVPTLRTWTDWHEENINWLHIIYSFDILNLCIGVLWLVLSSVTFCYFFVMPDEAAMARLFWCRTNSSLRKSENVFRLWGSDRTKRTSSMLWRSLTWAEWTPSRERTEHLGNAAQPWGFVNSSVGVSIFLFLQMSATVKHESIRLKTKSAASGCDQWGEGLVFPQASLHCVRTWKWTFAQHCCPSPNGVMSQSF